jgi:hypothetical protein
MAFRRSVHAQEQSASKDEETPEQQEQQDEKQGEMSDKEDFVHYLLERPILLILLDREDVVRRERTPHDHGFRLTTAFRCTLSWAD